MLQRALFWHQSVSDGGGGGLKRIFSAVRLQGSSRSSPNTWGQERRAKGQHPETLREDMDTSKEEEDHKDM